MKGRGIRIFLVDGTPTGLRTAELGLSTIKAVLTPRGSLQQFAQRNESRKTGVYFLVGADPEAPTRLRIYIGEGDEVLQRILAHDKDEEKDFWDRAVVFVSKDQNLTKAHVRFLEARLVELAKEARRCTVDNRTAPVGGTLPEADAAEMEEFVEQVKILLAILGVNAFESPPAVEAPHHSERPLTLHAKGDGYEAVCVLWDGEFVVKKDSIARSDEKPSIPAAAKEQRKQLLASGVLIQTEDGFRFAQDFAFSSASAAAQILAGTSVNGRTFWKLPDGRSLKEWQEAQIAAGSSSDNGN